MMKNFNLKFHERKYDYNSLKKYIFIFNIYLTFIFVTK